MSEEPRAFRLFLSMRWYSDSELITFSAIRRFFFHFMAGNGRDVGHGERNLPAHGCFVIHPRP